MTIGEALKKYYKIETELFLSHVLRKSKEFVFIHLEKSLSADQLISLSALARRRMRGEPMAYILGYKDFYGLRFEVNRNVLVPRPETEMAVDLVLAKLRSPSPFNGEGARRAGEVKYKDLTSLSAFGRHLPIKWGECSADDLESAPIKILDLGTGSGNIIVSLAKSLSPSPSPSPSGRGKPQVPPPLEGRLEPAPGSTRGGGVFEFYASDISKKALAVARHNAKKHRVKIKFIHSDILKNARMNFDVIIANLPYGWKGWENESSMETIGLKFEPKQALFTKEKGLMAIRRLLEQIAGLKQKPKFVFLEFDPRQKLPLAKLIKKSLPKSKIKYHKDYTNLWRYAEIGVLNLY